MMLNPELRTAVGNTAAGTSTVTVAAVPGQRIYVYQAGMLCATAPTFGAIDLRDNATTKYGTCNNGGVEFTPQCLVPVTSINTALNVVFTATGGGNTTGYVIYATGP